MRCSGSTILCCLLPNKWMEVYIAWTSDLRDLTQTPSRNIFYVGTQYIHRCTQYILSTYTQNWHTNFMKQCPYDIRCTMFYFLFLFFKKFLIVFCFLFFLSFNFYLFIYLFMAVLGLRFCARAFSSCGKWGPLFIAVRGPLIIAASLVAEHRLQTRRLSNCGSRA